MSFLDKIMRKSDDGSRHLPVGLIVVVICVIAGIAISAYDKYRKANVIEEVIIEAGTEITPDLFFKRPIEGATIDDSSDIYSTERVGTYNMHLNDGTYLYQSVLKVVDTVAPTAEAVDVRLELGETCTEKDFITNLNDATNVKIELEEPIDFKKTGKRDVVLHLSDQGGNTLDLTAVLNITCVKTELTVEAGNGVPPIEDFVLAGETYKYITDMEAIDYAKLQETNVEIEVDDCSYTSLMKLVDTTKPTLELQDVEGFTLVEVPVEDFIVAIEDVTQTTVEFVKAPDFEKEGEQEVEIVVEDEGKNKTTAKAKLTLEKDTVPPSIRGVRNITMTAGDSIDFRSGVSVADNCPVGYSLSVDSSGVNTSVPGTYTVSYNAKDLAGNVSRASAVVTVVARPN